MMRTHWLATPMLVAGVLATSLAFAQEAYVEAPFYPLLEPNEMPVPAFFAPAGRPLQRYAGRPNAWYAVMQLAMQPGQPYLLMLSTPADPEHFRVASFDDDPFANPGTQTEIGMQAIGPRVHRSFTIAATVRIAPDAAVQGVYLLIEWLPDYSTAYGPAYTSVAPPPVRLQAIAVYPPAQMLGGRSAHWQSPAATRGDNVRSPLSTPPGGSVTGTSVFPINYVQELAVPRQRAVSRP